MTEKQIERFKLEYQLQKKYRDGKYSYATLAGELGYAEITTSISRFLSESREFKSYDALARLWGVREEYLRCEDDFRTDADIERAGGVQRTHDIEVHIQYLETLGYIMKPRLLLHISPEWHSDGIKCSPIDSETWELIKPTLMDGALDMPINEERTRTLADWDGEEVIPAWFTSFIPVKQTVHGSLNDGYQFVDSPDAVDQIEGVQYTLEYLIYEGDKLVAQMTMLQLRDLFDRIDDYARLTASLQLAMFDGEERETVYAVG